MNRTTVHRSGRVMILAASVALAVTTLALGRESVPATETQVASAEVGPPQFDIVSLRKIADVDTKWGGMQHTPGFIQTPRDSLLDLIELAYDVEAQQIVGAPNWAHSIRYKIVLSAPESTFAGPFHGEAHALRMVQTVLADRFKLVFHRESRFLTAAALVVGPAGIKMKHSQQRPGDWQGIDLVSGRLVGQSAPMARLTRIIALSTGKPVLDKTGLTGTYDFDARWRTNEGNLSSHQWHYVGTNPPSPAAMNAISSSSFEDALEAQLGLMLEPPKNTYEEFIVIDNVEQPPET